MPKIIKEINASKNLVKIKPVKDGEKGAVLVSEDEWNAIQETLYLVSQGVDKLVSERKNDNTEDFDKIWEKLKN